MYAGDYAVDDTLAADGLGVFKESLVENTIAGFVLNLRRTFKHMQF